MQGTRPARREMRVENRAPGEDLRVENQAPGENLRVENQAPGEDLRDPIPGLHMKVGKPMMEVEHQVPGEDLSVSGTYLKNNSNT